VSSPLAYRARLDTVFAEALDLPPSERAPFLDRACGGDAALRADVDELLALAAKPSTDLEPGRLAEGPLLRALASDLEAPEVGARVGSWRVVRELGRGGMGTVFLAERDDGAFRLAAALKVVREGHLSDDLVRRFEREREILARLQHPNVARLMDGGQTAEGRPYFVMEYVEGRPIDAYCDEHRLAVDQRLALFLSVGRAVQHAHRNLVVHRDLKPSNIVVTTDGAVKLLDFGIAKLLTPEAEPGAPLTGTQARLLTPEYASPEQMLGQPVTTASDVYQLGLLLYELLTGQRAHRTMQTSPAALQEAVCERQPTRPSALVTTAGDASTVAAARGTTPSALSRRLRGDLDTIVLVALRKEPERRYGSVEALLDDVERYRQGLPLRARGDTLGYRARKFVQRHALGVTTAAAFGLLLFGYAATVTSQARQLARERDRAQTEARKAGRVRDFLVGLFQAADPSQAKGEQVTAAELVDAGTRVARETLAAEPEVQAEMLGVLGRVLHERASYDRAEPLLAEALALQRRLHREDHPDLARALGRYADIVTEKGDFARAEQLAREGLEMQRRLFGDRSAEVAEAIAPVDTVISLQGRFAESEAMLRKALAIRLALPPPQDVAPVWNALGISLAKQRKHDEADTAYRAALQEYRRTDPNGPREASVLNNLAIGLVARGQLAEAETLHRQSLAIRRRVYGPEHTLVALSLYNLGSLQRRQGRTAEAIATHREALALRRKAFPPGHSNIAMSLNALAQALRDEGQLREAETLLRQAIVDLRRAGHWSQSTCALNLARLLVATGRAGEAEPLLREALALRIAKDGETSAAADEARLALGIWHAAQGQHQQAREWITPALQRLRGAADAETQLLAEAEAALVAAPAVREAAAIGS
jgi:tetratricopeptide (TPR) repeat protein/predicted Ser/Thr protein kinase